MAIEKTGNIAEGVTPIGDAEKSDMFIRPVRVAEARRKCGDSPVIPFDIGEDLVKRAADLVGGRNKA